MSQQESHHRTTPPSADKARVSVVVPSYNHASFVEATLHSIFNQTLPVSELLVIDDGSADGSPGIIEKVLKDCPVPCEFISRPNQGLCATLNEGLSKTGGEYFAYLGSDDLWLTEFIAARVSTLESRLSAVLAYGHSFLIDDENHIIDCTLDWAHYVDGNAKKMLLEQSVAPMSPTVVYRRSALVRHGWNEQSRLEDYELYLRLSAEGDFAFDPRVLSAWRQHGYNASRDFSWMIDARLAAQRRAGDLLGLSPGELERLQRVSQFAGAEDLLRLGEKSRAFKLLRQNITGAPSNASLLRTVGRLCVPYTLIKWQKRRKQAQAAQRYGTLII